MASFTDKNLQPFTPYVSQLPVEDMVKVGMEKQGMYNQGVERIQSNIDKVAGLDIARGLDKNYLQSKLNALTSNVRMVAAGDFSNNQLVNSVNGMTASLYQDKNIQTAVASTSNIKAQYAKRAALEKEGLTDVNNDLYFQKDVNAYMQGQELTDTFNSEYKPYTDINKLLKEALVGIGENESLVDNLFIMENGKPKVFSDGLHYADVKTTEHLITNREQVTATINSVLSKGNVRQQLQIDGYATYKDTPVDYLLSPLQKNYEDNHYAIEEKILMNTALLSSRNLSENNRELLVKNALELENASQRNIENFQNLLNSSRNNPDEFKENLYAQQFKSLAESRYIKDTRELTYDKNPGKEQENWEEKMRFDYTQEANKINYQNQTLAISRSADARGWEEFYAKSEVDPITGQRKMIDNKEGKNKAGDPSLNINDVFNTNISGEKESAIKTMQEDIVGLTSTRDKISFELYAELMRKQHNNPNLSDQVILNSVNGYAKQTKVTPSEFLNRWAEKMDTKYVEAGLSPNLMTQNKINQHKLIQRTLSDKKNIDDKFKKEADSEVGLKTNYESAVNKIPNLKFTVEGEKFELSNQELLELTIREDIEPKGNKLAKKLAFTQSGADEINKNRVAYTPNQLKIVSKLNSLPSGIRDSFMKQYKEAQIIGKTYKESLKKSREVYNKKLETIVGTSNNIGGPIYMTSDKGSVPTIERIGSFATERKESYEGGTAEEFKSSLKDAGSVSWSAKKPTSPGQEWTGSITVNTKDGKAITMYGLNQGNLELLSQKKLDSYIPTPVADAIRVNKTKSTNAKSFDTDPNAWKTSRYNNGDVNPAVSNAGYEFRADIIEAPGGYSFIYYIKPKNSDKFTKRYDTTIIPTEEGVDSFLKTIVPKDLDNFINLKK